MKYTLINRNTPDIWLILKTNHISHRYINRRFTLVALVGDYGIFQVPDRKQPFMIHMKSVELCD